MKDEINPIKRSKQLAPLSREHHDGLLFAWKIKQGIALNATVEQMRNFALWYWRHHIKPHFFQEEKILLPYLPPDNPMKHRLKEEHDHIRELIIGLDEGTDADKRHLIILSDLINQHIRFEERELFPFMEQLLTPEQLDSVFSQLEAHPLTCEEWTDEFWIKKKE
ncbi:MAG TPA: hemerythrin domain-containing protein [Chitinophagaceae bacterium]|nr:hemerythrin domain-containing protein [Chitinophagaceae bacterium]